MLSLCLYNPDIQIRLLFFFFNENFWQFFWKKCQVFGSQMVIFRRVRSIGSFSSYTFSASKHWFEQTSPSLHCIIIIVTLFSLFLFWWQCSIFRVRKSANLPINADSCKTVSKDKFLGTDSAKKMALFKNYLRLILFGKNELFIIYQSKTTTRLDNSWNTHNLL